MPKSDGMLEALERLVKAIYAEFSCLCDPDDIDVKGVVSHAPNCPVAAAESVIREARQPIERYVIIADGEGASVTLVEGDPHQPLHDFMCCCGKPWAECKTNTASIDDQDEWSFDEDGQPFSVSWEYETGRTTLYRNRAGARNQSEQAAAPTPQPGLQAIEFVREQLPAVTGQQEPENSDRR